MVKILHPNTMRWKILKYNIIVIIGFIVLTTVVFNIAIRFYMEKDLSKQLLTIAKRAENTALLKGPDFLPKDNVPPPKDRKPSVDENGKSIRNAETSSHNIYEFYFMLDRSLKETMSVLNADFLLIDSDKNIINNSKDGYFMIPDDLINKINNELNQSDSSKKESYLNFKISDTDYIAVVKSVSHKNSFGLGWVIIYSSLENINQLQLVINLILLIILIITSIVSVLFSSIAAKKISAPFSSLNRHLSEIAERNFDTKLDLPVDDELQEFVKNINTMSQKLATYDKAQKTFLQNASHEFRTPLMSIQSYAEGIKYQVIDKDSAVAVILEETKRMTALVEDLMYLSRLDTLEENYHFKSCNIITLINSCIERMKIIAGNSNIVIDFDNSIDPIYILADEEKLSRAITNILSNDIRYAESRVAINIKVSDEDANMLYLSILDDGIGFDSNELTNIFDRFYKGKKGNSGLGLAIAKNVIERHNGKISAENTGNGALFLIKLKVEF
jgi:signal transduction histidine kinase